MSAAGPGSWPRTCRREPYARARGLSPEEVARLLGAISADSAAGLRLRARKEAAIASFLGWAYRHDLIAGNPMGKVERVHLETPTPRGLPSGQVEAILAVIPAQCRRDRLLFRLIAELGLRAGEALGLQVEDVDLTPDDEQLSVLGKGGRRRTVLIDGDSLVAQLRTYLRHTSYRHGSLFRPARHRW